MICDYQQLWLCGPVTALIQTKAVHPLVRKQMFLLSKSYGEASCEALAELLSLLMAIGEDKLFQG